VRPSAWCGVCGRAEGASVWGLMTIKPHKEAAMAAIAVSGSRVALQNGSSGAKESARSESRPVFFFLIILKPRVE